jgi:hypothetical protein
MNDRVCVPRSTHRSGLVTRSGYTGPHGSAARRDHRDGDRGGAERRAAPRLLPRRPGQIPHRAPSAAGIGCGITRRSESRPRHIAPGWASARARPCGAAWSAAGRHSHRGADRAPPTTADGRQWEARSAGRGAAGCGPRSAGLRSSRGSAADHRRRKRGRLSRRRAATGPPMPSSDAVPGGSVSRRRLRRSAPRDQRRPRMVPSTCSSPQPALPLPAATAAVRMAPGR